MRKMQFTIIHGLAASLALHGALGLPFVLSAFAAPPEEPAVLVVDIQGLLANSQTEQKAQTEKKGELTPDSYMPREAEAPTPPPAPEEVAQEAPPAPPPEETPQDPPAPAVEATTRPQTQQGAGANNISGAETLQNAQTIKLDQETEAERLRAYVKLLSKKVEANLVYPAEGREAGLKGAATISFAILADGAIRAETVRIVQSSGQPKLDASALKTIRASAPFDPPPKVMTVAITVSYGRRP